MTDIDTNNSTKPSAINAPSEIKKNKYTEQGFKIYYLPEIRRTNLRVSGIDLIEYGALPLLSDEQP